MRILRPAPDSAWRRSLALALAVTASASACGGARVRPDAAGKRPAADWTLLVYLAADDDLERAGLRNIQEMATVAGGDRVDVVVQIDRAAAKRSGRGYSRAPLLNLPDFSTVKRLRVERGAVVELADLGETSTGDEKTLADFVAWGVKSFPAKKIALVLWDHGGATTGFGWDSSNGEQGLEIPQIRSAIATGLREGGRAKLDLLGFDACLMGNLEVGYELRELADVLVASEELEPAHGWAYPPLLTTLAGGASAVDAAKTIVGAYEQKCREHKTVNGCTLSAVRTSELANVVASLDALAGDLGEKAASDAGWLELAKARGAAERYGAQPGVRDPFGAVDVVDFATRVPASAAHVKAVTDAMGAATIASFHGAGRPGARGLSVVFPSVPAHRRPDDENLGMSRHAPWAGLIQGYLARAAKDTTPPVVSEVTALPIEGGKGYKVRASVVGDDVDELDGIVAREAPGGAIVLLSRTTLAPSAPTFDWDRTLASLTDGAARSPVTTFEEDRFTDDAGRHVRLLAIEARFLPAGGGPDDAFDVTLYLEQPDGGPAVVRGIYQLDDDGEAGEIETEAGDRVEPLLFGLDAQDRDTWTPSGAPISVGELDKLALVTGAAPKGKYLVGILAVDYAEHESEKTVVVTVP